MKKQLLILVIMILPLMASADAVEIDGIYYKLNTETKEATVTYKDYNFNSYSGNVIIPSSVNYSDVNYSVTSIGNEAFGVCPALSSITIPNSVTNIGERAFTNCSGLTSITIPNSVTSIGDEAFWYCDGLASIEVASGNTRYDSRDHCNAIILTSSNKLMNGCKNTVIPNSVTSIGNSAFAGCSGLTFIAIPNSVTSIGEAAFISCTGLTSVTIGNSVTSIGEYAFFECSGITSVTIPNSVTIIDNYAFRKCSGLTSVTIPNSVTYIGNLAFSACSGLTSVTIPNSVISIGFCAFDGCSGLTSVTIGNSVTIIGNNAFEGCDISIIVSLIENPFTINGKTSSLRTFSQNTFDNATLYVPKGTIDKYKSTYGWHNFNNIVDGIPAGINVVKNTKNNNTTIYDLNGVRQPEPKKGLNIVNGKKVVVK